jgi:hypothetical protein
MKPYAGVIDLSQDMLNDYAAPYPVRTPQQELDADAKRADTIVIGTATGKLSALTPRHCYVYSDWTIKVTKVFKNVSTLEVIPGSEITVVEAGGDFTINGVRVVGHDRAAPELTVWTRLRSLPESLSGIVVVSWLAENRYYRRSARPAARPKRSQRLAGVLPNSLKGRVPGGGSQQHQITAELHR